MILTCDCCKVEREFVDEEEAFQQGWDAEPYFHGYVACDLCPASLQFMPGGWGRHEPIHEQWKANGRPDVFKQETCMAPEDHIDMDAARKLVEGLGVKDVAEFKAALLNYLGGSDGTTDDC